MCKPSDDLLREWTRQQREMAGAVITVDDVPWSLDAVEPGRRLQRVAGLDISFLEATTEQRLTNTLPDRTEGPGCAKGVACGAEDAAGTAGRRAGEDEEEDRSGIAAGVVTSGPGVAALVVLSFPDLKVLYEDYEPVDLTIPYLPGYLGFREVDTYARLLLRVKDSPHCPQALLVDGCGVLHPRACGSACQVGVKCGYPAVGVAKNLLAVDGLDRFKVRRMLQEAAAAGAGADEGVKGPSSTRSVPPATSGQGLLAAATHSSSRGPAAGLWCNPDDAARISSAGSIESHTTGGVASGDTNKASGQGGGGHPSAAASVGVEAGPGHRGARVAAQGGPPVRDVQVALRGVSGRIHGSALCPGVTTRPLYISVGHRLSLATAVELVRRCCLHRIPEPVRQADLRSREWLRRHLAAPGSVESGGMPTGAAVK